MSGEGSLIDNKYYTQNLHFPLSQVLLVLQVLEIKISVRNLSFAQHNPFCKGNTGLAVY